MIGMSCAQEEREKLIVRRFKFEEPRLEQIHDLEVCPLECSLMVFCFAAVPLST